VDALPPSDGDDKQPVSEAELQKSQDLSFGGWRDWLAVLIFGPIFVAALVAGAAIWLNGKHVPVTWPIVAVALISAVLGSLIWRARD
jgi:hypothetical protein